jgi:hypothetical protein
LFIISSFVNLPAATVGVKSSALSTNSQLYKLCGNKMSGKRPSQQELRNKSAKMGRMVAATTPAHRRPANSFLANPVDPVQAIQDFLQKVQTEARRLVPSTNHNKKQQPGVEVEARLGTLATANRRVTSSGDKKVQGTAFDCSDSLCQMVPGTSRAHFMRHTGTGLGLVSAMTRALGATNDATLKQDLKESISVETVYTYANDIRICFAGDDPQNGMTGRKELKKSLQNLDLCLPAAKYDLRVSLKTEQPQGSNVSLQEGWTSKRVKVRHSYKRRKEEGSYWRIDVTEVTTQKAGKEATHPPTIDYEIEVELLPLALHKLINETDQAALQSRALKYGTQLWQIMTQLNPLQEPLEVEEQLQPHPDVHAVQSALRRLESLEKFLAKQKNNKGNNEPSTDSHNVRRRHQTFIGCMPINFARHHLERILRLPPNAYYLSEKTDGQRFLAVVLEKTVVLVNRKMEGKQPISKGNNTDPFFYIQGKINPGTVLDGEVVMNRRKGQEPRPIFIVFDVLAVSAKQPVLHLNFEHRLKYLERVSFATKDGPDAIFNASHLSNESIALPLVRKEFFKRRQCDRLLSRVSEKCGMRIYKAPGALHNHLTDGIIFQPNLPYTCRTDHNLLKWKYLDTVTVDVRLLPDSPTKKDEEQLPSECFTGGPMEPRIDMTTHVILPRSERLRLEADKYESQGKIAEVGFDAEIGEWYYLTMRADKSEPNRLQTVLGSMGELAESISPEELQFRMSIPPGHDTYWRDVQKMKKQMHHHQLQTLASCNN